MGLDMYVFKAHPPKDDPNVVYKYKEMLDKGYSIFPDEDIEDESVRILKEYAVPFNLSVEKFDLKKISATYRLKNNIRISNVSNNGTVFTDGNKEVTIKEDELKNFIYEEEEVFWLMELEEVGYWRKEYELQNQIYEMFKKDGIEIENCGYYKLDKNKIYEIDKYNNGEQGLIYHIDDDLFYHEWY